MSDLEDIARRIVRMADPVYADSRNTTAVRANAEVGGYIKDYLVAPHLIHELENLLEGEVDE